MHNDQINDLDLFRIPGTICNVRAFKLNINVVVNVSFDTSSRLLGFVRFMDLYSCTS